MANINPSDPLVTISNAEFAQDELIAELNDVVTFIEGHIDNQFKGGEPRSPLEIVDDTVNYVFSGYDFDERELSGNYLPINGVNPPENLGSGSLFHPFIALGSSFEGEFEFVDGDAVVTLGIKFGVSDDNPIYYVQELILRREQIYVSGKNSVTREIGITRNELGAPIKVQLKDVVYFGRGVASLEFDVPRGLDDVKGTILSELKDVEPPSIDYLPNHNGDVIELNRQGRKPHYHIRWNSTFNYYNVILNESNRDDFRFLEEIGFRENYRFENKVECTISREDLWAYFNPCVNEDE